MGQPEASPSDEGWQEEREGRTVGEAFAELRAICAEEGYELRLPPREDRASMTAQPTDNDARLLDG